MNAHNGSPLYLNGPQRQAALSKLGLSQGWCLVSVSEMLDMQKAMEGSTKENERLNKQTARLVAVGLVNSQIFDKTIQSARAFLLIVAEKDAEPTFRVDALREISHIDEALEVLPKPFPSPKGNNNPTALK